MEMLTDEAVVNEDRETSCSQSDAGGTTGSPDTQGDQHEEASAFGNVEQQSDLAVQGIQNLNLADEVKNEVSETSSPNTEADFETILAAKHPMELCAKSLHLPPVPEIDVTLSRNHQTYPLGIVHSIDGKEVTVKGVGPHTLLDEQSILWITESRELLGYVDRISETKTPYYVIRYNNEDETLSGVGIGTHVSFVPEFANMLNDDYLYESGHNASHEIDEELPEEAKISKHEKEVNYMQTLNTCASHNSQHPQATETPCNHTYPYSERSQGVLSSPRSGGVRPNAMAVQWQPQPIFFSNGILTNGTPQTQSIIPAGGYQGMVEVIQHNGGSGGVWVWSNGMAIQQQQQPVYLSNVIPANGIPQNIVPAGGCQGMVNVVQHNGGSSRVRVRPNGMAIQQQQQPMYFSNASPTASRMHQNSLVHAGGPETSNVYWHTSNPTSFYTRSDRVRPTDIEIQNHQQPMSVPNAFRTNGTTLMQQPNTLVRAGGQGMLRVFLPTSLPTSRMSLQHEQQVISNVFYTDGMPWMPNLVQNPHNIPTRMPIPQQFAPSPMLPSTSLELENQQPQQPMFYSNTFPTNGMPQTLQNCLVERPQYIMTPMAIPFQQQPIPEPTLIQPYFHFNVGQHVLVGGSISDRPFPWVFGPNSGNESREESTAITVTPMSGVFLTIVPPSTGQNRAAPLPLTTPANTDRGHQVHPSVPPITQWRDCSGEKEGHCGSGVGSRG